MTMLAPQSAKAPHVAHLSEQAKKGMRRGRETKARLNLISTFALPAVPTCSPGARPHGREWRTAGSPGPASFGASRSISPCPRSHHHQLCR